MKSPRTIRLLAAVLVSALLGAIFVVSGAGTASAAPKSYRIKCNAGGSLTSVSTVSHQSGRTFVEAKSMAISKYRVGFRNSPANGQCAWLDRGVRDGERSVDRIIMETTGKSCPEGLYSSANSLVSAVHAGQIFYLNVYRTVLPSSHPMYRVGSSNNVLVAEWECLAPIQ